MPQKKPVTVKRKTVPVAALEELAVQFERIQRVMQQGAKELAGSDDWEDIKDRLWFVAKAEMLKEVVTAVRSLCHVTKRAK